MPPKGCANYICSNFNHYEFSATKIFQNVWLTTLLITFEIRSYTREHSALRHTDGRYLIFSLVGVKSLNCQVTWKQWAGLLWRVNENKILLAVRFKPAALWYPTCASISCSWIETTHLRFYAKNWYIFRCPAEPGASLVTVFFSPWHISNFLLPNSL